MGTRKAGNSPAGRPLRLNVDAIVFVATLGLSAFVWLAGG